MTIAINQPVPQTTLYVMGDKGPKPITTDELLRGKRVVLFGLPGAFTPTCSAAHLPGYVALADKLKARGIDTIGCVSVNDAFVMQAWGQQHNADAIQMLADGSAALTNALGLALDLTARGMGVRSQRYAMIVNDGIVTDLNVEAPGKFEVSDAQTMLGLLG